MLPFSTFLVWITNDQFLPQWYERRSLMHIVVNDLLA